jgi:hypothetical protein
VSLQIASGHRPYINSVLISYLLGYAIDLILRLLLIYIAKRNQDRSTLELLVAILYNRLRYLGINTILKQAIKCTRGIIATSLKQVGISILATLEFALRKRIYLFLLAQ